MNRVRKPDDPLVICEDCGKTRPAPHMVRLSPAWLCRDCWRIDTHDTHDTHDTQGERK